MKKIVAATLVAFSLFASAQPSFANSFRKHGAGTQGAKPQSNPGTQGLALGAFFTDCEFFETAGKASASLQTIVVDNHNQATVQLKASGGGAAYSYLENPLSTLTIIKTPITFNLVKGNGNFLGVSASFIPHNSTTETFIDFATPDSKLGNFFSPLATMTTNGNGGFALPLGDGVNGLPQGSRLTGLFFVEFGNPNNCDNKNSNVNHLMINNRPIGIDATSEAAFCDDGCGEKE